MRENNLFLAADSGGSKTEWILIKSDGSKVASIKTKGLGAVKEGLLPISDIVKEAYHSLTHYGKIDSIYLSLGGPNVTEVENALKSVWADCSVRVEREANGNAILAAAKMLDCNSVIMCGTGSTAMGNTKSGRKYCGGWGPIYGDGGSGGGMGTDALRLFLRHLDGVENIGKVSQIFDFLTHGLEIEKFTDRMEVKARALGLSRRELASTAPKIYDLFVEGDKTASDLYCAAADEVAKMAYAVSDNSVNDKVLLCGGFFANKPKFLEECHKSFIKISNAKLLYNESFSPIVAAQMAVLSDNDVVIDNDLFKKLLHNKGE